MPRPTPQTAHLVASPDDAEAQFYEALREADIERLMAIWSDDDEIVCVHPGGTRVIGVRAIRASFEALFANGGIPVQVEQVRRVLSLEVAMHNVIEHVVVATAEGPRSGYAIATNVFLKTALGWRLVVHHASAGSAPEASEFADAPATLH